MSILKMSKKYEGISACDVTDEEDDVSQEQEEIEIISQEILAEDAAVAREF
jgi:hypothetical protein